VIDNKVVNLNNQRRKSRRKLKKNRVEEYQNIDATRRNWEVGAYKKRRVSLIW
jgi:hypothetical protein